MSTLESLTTLGGGNLSSISSLSTFVPLSGGANGMQMLAAYVAVVLVLFCSDEDLNQLKANPKDAEEWKRVLLSNERVQLSIAIALTLAICKPGACSIKVQGLKINVQGAMMGALLAAVGCCCDQKVQKACGLSKEAMMALGAAVGALL